MSSLSSEKYLAPPIGEFIKARAHGTGARDHTEKVKDLHSKPHLSKSDINKIYLKVSKVKVDLFCKKLSVVFSVI